MLVAAFDHLIAPDRVFAAYGLANIAGAIPLTPGAGTPHGEAILTVLTWRLVNFWLPTPVGGLAFLSLRAGPLRGRARPHAPG
ncbi:hypothetical protein BLA60_15020 [Actinophytocola xinjiangensis]|uniref:Uncharacterized protein n=1 Tax=Actinophytocola xinjiangensis TaxID=485602 RepID=A0A7Z0WLV3_9PSEU|nr:hypothetical protein BLA60_15020 [Actinophytocola xinjiangensis]